jgi:hypothetical protein
MKQKLIDLYTNHKKLTLIIGAFLLFFIISVFYIYNLEQTKKAERNLFSGWGDPYDSRTGGGPVDDYDGRTDSSSEFDYLYKCWNACDCDYECYEEDQITNDCTCDYECYTEYEEDEIVLCAAEKKDDGVMLLKSDPALIKSKNILKPETIALVEKFVEISTCNDPKITVEKAYKNTFAPGMESALEDISKNINTGNIYLVAAMVKFIQSANPNLKKEEAVVYLTEGVDFLHKAKLKHPKSEAVNTLVEGINEKFNKITDNCFFKSKLASEKRRNKPGIATKMQNLLLQLPNLGTPEFKI